MTVLPVQSLPVLANQHRHFFCSFSVPSPLLRTFCASSVYAKVCLTGIDPSKMCSGCWYQCSQEFDPAGYFTLSTESLAVSRW